MSRFSIKSLKDGRAMLNLACGGRMHPEWNNVDFSPLVRLARHPRLARMMRVCGILSEKRYRRLLATDPNLICWDLRRGIPFDSDTFDVVYHSHFLEHIDRDAARGFLRECGRVLKPSGIIRIVVPDLHQFCREYLTSYEQLVQQRDSAKESIREHDDKVSRLIRQMIVAEPSGTKEQLRLIRAVERLVRGNNVKAGEAHRWMYDSFTLCQVLQDAGFVNITRESSSGGRIGDWSAFALDVDEDGSPYKSRSLYVEAQKAE